MADETKDTSAAEAKVEELTKAVEVKIEGYLKASYEDHYEKHDDGRFLVYEGSTVVQIVIRPWHADDVVVECFAYVVQDAKISDVVMQYLLRQNAILHFGGFGLSFDDTIVYSHSIAGANLDENEFLGSVKSVSSISDYYDDKIVEMAGGMTAAEAMSKGVI